MTPRDMFVIAQIIGDQQVEPGASDAFIRCKIQNYYRIADIILKVREEANGN